MYLPKQIEKNMKFISIVKDMKKINLIIWIKQTLSHSKISHILRFCKDLKIL